MYWLLTYTYALEENVEEFDDDDDDDNTEASVPME